MQLILNLIIEIHNLSFSAIERSACKCGERKKCVSSAVADKNDSENNNVIAIRSLTGKPVC